MSKLETKWLNYLKIPKKYRQTTIFINGKKYIVDAYDPRTNTIYEFNGDYWHGNPAKYASRDTNKQSNKTFGKLHKDTIKRESIFKLAGYNIISIWESDFLKLIL